MPGLGAILINQRVLHSHVRLLLRSLNRSSRGTSDLTVFELQTFRKTFDRNRAFLHFKALRQRTKAFRLHILGVLRTNSASSQRRIRDHNLGNNTLLLLLRNRGLLSLLNKLGRIFLIRVLVDRITVFISDTNQLLNHDFNLTGHSHLRSTGSSRSTRDLAGCFINRQTLRQSLGGILRRSTLNLVGRRILKQRSNLISGVLVVPRTQWQLLRHNRSKGVCDLPTIHRFTRRRINTDHSSRVNRGFLQVLRSLEITRLQRALVIALELAHLVLELNLVTLSIGGEPTDRIIRIRHQPGRLRGHLRTRTTLIVVGVVLRNIKERLRRHQREL